MGSFNNGKKQGLGKYIWADQRSYTGFWDKGKQFGLGLYTNENNEELFGIWINGKRNRWLNEEEVSALRNEKDEYFEQIINFDVDKYNFIEEKEKLENMLKRDNN